jgi:hypothetical protein
VSDYTGRDKRGNPFVFPQRAWDHATKHRGHFDGVKGAHPLVMRAVENATLVLTNETLGPFRLNDVPERKAGERYVHFSEDLGEYIVVPVIVEVSRPYESPGASPLLPPIRIATTAYTQDEIPNAEVIWKWPPE